MLAETGEKPGGRLLARRNCGDALSLPESESTSTSALLARLTNAVFLARVQDHFASNFPPASMDGCSAERVITWRRTCGLKWLP